MRLLSISIKSIKVVSLLLIGVLFLGGCQQSLTPKDYYNWVQSEKNGLKKVKTIHPLRVELQYQPAAFLVVNHLRKEDISRKELEDEMLKYKDLQYFSMKLSMEGTKDDLIKFTAKDPSERDKLMNYLSYGMQQDVKLIEGTDTLNLALFHFEKAYDLEKSRTFLIAFERKKDSETASKTFVLDVPLWKTGPIKMTIERNDLLKVPTIKIQS